MLKVLISGYYGSKNAGDEAMLAAMIQLFARLHAQLHITVISADPKETAQRHGVEAIGWLDLPAIVSALRNSDLLISGGGSLLQNVTSGRSLYYYLSVIELARWLGTPVMLYAQGIGPVCGGLPRWLMRRILDGVDAITVRDKGSLVELQQLGVNRPRMEVTADPVLAISRATLDSGEEILRAHKVNVHRPMVGISVREWRGLEQYKTAIAATADRIVADLGAACVFIPMQYPEDVSVAKAIAKQTSAPIDSVIVLDDHYSTDELLSLVGNLDLLIAIRLHALIFAGVMRVPMIGLSYDPKIDRFLDSIGERATSDLPSLTTKALCAAVDAKWTAAQEHHLHHALSPDEQLLGELCELAERNAHIALGLLGAHPA